MTPGSKESGTLGSSITNWFKADVDAFEPVEAREVDEDDEEAEGDALLVLEDVALIDADVEEAGEEEEEVVVVVEEEGEVDDWYT